MIWLSSNEGHLRKRNVTIRLLHINLGRVTRIFVITGWRVELVAPSNSRNHSVYMLQNTYFVEKKWKDEMDTCMLCHEEIPKKHKIHEELPKMDKIIWRTSKNAQNPIKNFKICTKSHEVLPKMHKIPWLTSNNAQNSMRNFQNVHNPMRNSQICTILRGTSKKHKVPRVTSKIAQNPMRNFQKCTKSLEELPKMHKIPRGTSKNAQNCMGNFQICTK